MIGATRDDGQGDGFGAAYVFSLVSPELTPVAHAGPDQIVRVGTPVTVDGTASSDPGGLPLTYVWTIVQAPAGSTAFLTTPTASIASFTPDLAGDYGLQLIVTNNAGLASAPDSVTITATHIADPPVGLSDSEEPGSVLVFPKFLSGTTAHGEPRSEFEIGITCPRDPDGGPGVCAEGFKVKLRAHWVCPGSQDPVQKYICKETNFDLTSTVNGTIVINPANVGHVTQRVPPPPVRRAT